jgi:hypothetical protein
MRKNKIASGCATNRLLSFPGHFLSPNFRRFEENGLFQQPQAITLIDPQLVAMAIRQLRRLLRLGLLPVGRPTAQ